MGLFAPGPLFAGFLVGTIGVSLFIYGKKASRMPQMIAGAILVITALYFSCRGAVGMLVTGAVVIAALWIAVRQGW